MGGFEERWIVNELGLLVFIDGVQGFCECFRLCLVFVYTFDLGIWGGREVQVPYGIVF